MSNVSEIRILSVEDDADSRDLLEFVLADYKVVFADNIKFAIHLFQNDKFDLCLLDGRLSDGEGTDLCSELRKISKDVPIVFASGAAQQKDIDCAMQAGAQAYLVKPYFPENLLKIVKELTE